MLNLPRINIDINPVGQGAGFDFSKKVSVDYLSSIIRYGVDRGMNFIDTAELYGEGLSEKIVGKAISSIRDKVVIATKFAPEHSSCKELIKACEGSLRRLKIDCIDLYQFHWPNPRVPLSETIKALNYLKKTGKIKNIGLTNFSKPEIAKAAKLCDIASVQAEYNLFERGIEQNGIYNFCKKNKITIIAYSPLDQGRLSLLSSEQSKLISYLSFKYSKSPAQIILAWLISHNGVIAIPRTTKKTHLVENLSATSFSLEQSDVLKINEAFYIKLINVPINKICFSNNQEENSKVLYKTLDEAIENKLGFTPSPKDISEDIKNTGLIKPVRLIRKKNKKDIYYLTAGRSRYWAWIIAYGNRRPIPSYVRKF